MQYGLTKGIGCDKDGNVQYTVCNVCLIHSKLKRHKELKYKENTNSVETFKTKRAGYDTKETLFALWFFPNFSTPPVFYC